MSQGSLFSIGGPDKELLYCLVVLPTCHSSSILDIREIRDVILYLHECTIRKIVHHVHHICMMYYLPSYVIIIVHSCNSIFAGMY